ncbi:patatin-like protein 2 [Dorcoceras hygrometricum]|uniref:Patatin-like protein 2 n=1 Tax=Dorcoceras hygrometricum TaxID=472368 RepID=A0A2Z7AXK0_9LAMI|nr:patatin-like protein 2 [Dorcoceras hygrometricum]
MFAAAFELPTEGLVDLTDVPKNFVFDARSLFSDSKEQVSMSCLKKAMKFQYRLLHDILAKTIYVKAGSFDSVTRDRFLLMTAITFDVKINWSSLLFGVFKEMVTPGSRQAKGYAIQICVLLRNVPGLELGESKAFPVPRVLNEKTVRRYVSIKERIGVEEVTDAPRAKKTPVKKTVPKKRQATGDAGVGQVVKKKRTTKGKPVSAKRISVEKQVDDCSTVEPPVEERATGVQGTSADFPVASQPAADPDAIIEQILTRLDTAAATQGDDQHASPATDSVPWFDLPFEIARRYAEGFLSSDTDEEFIADSLFPDTQTSLPTATVDLSSLLDALQASLCQRMDDANNEILSRLHSTERSLQTSLGHQNDYLRRLIESARQEGQTQDDIQLLRLNELRKSVMAHDVKAGTDSLDVRNKLNALDAKVLLLDGQIASIQNEQLEFQTRIAADILSLSTQLGDIVDYIRGGDAKKGEGSSSRPLSTPINQGVSSSGLGRGLSVEEAAEMIREADRREREREICIETGDASCFIVFGGSVI